MAELYLGLLTEPVIRTVARLELFRHANVAFPVGSMAIADAYEASRRHAARIEYIVNTLYATGSRRMEAYLRGDHWLTSGAWA